MAILVFRNQKMGLLLSELGAYICGFAHAPAGTKRISNLLRSKKWESKLVDNFLFAKAKERIRDLQARGLRPLLLWDDSRIEKPESWFMEGLCSVESSKGKRLTKIKKGFYHPPASRICVPGFHWTATMVSALGEIPSVCQMSWWTSRGKYKELASNIMFRMLKKLNKSLIVKVLHVLDRGYASAWTIEWMMHFEQDFLVRWKKNILLIHPQKGTKQTHQIARYLKSSARKVVLDTQRKITKHIGIAFCAVIHPEFPDKELYLIVVRDKKGRQAPMYLLTCCIVLSNKDAWQMLHSYMHRWNIEQTFRVGKAELGLESPRLWFWENRLKLMAIVTLVYDFLLSMLRNWSSFIPILLKNWCHRTGNRYRNASIPIYRLRLAISNCLNALIHLSITQNSG
ncbi:transposase [Emticicia agri]|nr:transposase [Emticicia agri]